MVETKRQINIAGIKSGDRTPEDITRIVKAIVGNQASPEQLSAAISIAVGLGVARLERTKVQKPKTPNK